MAGDAAAKALAGAGKAMNLGAQAAIGAATSYLGGVAGNYVNAFDFKSGTMDWEKGNAGWTDAATIASAVGSGISAGLGGLNLRDGNERRLNGETFNVGGIQSLNGLAGGLATSAVSFGMTGNATFNLASFNGVGLFELTVGKDGVSSRIGMGGTSISAETLMSAAEGTRESRKVGEWKYGGEEKSSTLNAINMLGYTGNELDVGMSKDVWGGKLGVEYKEMPETDGTRQYGEYTKGNGKIVLNKDLLGGGLEGSAKLASVMGHEGTHAYGNRVEGLAHVQANETYEKLKEVFDLKGDATFAGDILAGLEDAESWKVSTGDTHQWALEVDKQTREIGWRPDGSFDFTLPDGTVIPENMMSPELAQAIANRYGKSIMHPGIVSGWDKNLEDNSRLPIDLNMSEEDFRAVAERQGTRDILTQGFIDGTMKIVGVNSIVKDILSGGLSMKNIDKLQAALMGVQESGVLVKNPVRYEEGLISNNKGLQPYLPLTGEVSLTCFQGIRFVDEEFFGQVNDKTNFPLDNFATNDHKHTDLWSGNKSVVTSVEGSLKLNYDSVWGLNGTNYGANGYGAYLSNHLSAESILNYLEVFGMEGTKLRQLEGGQYVLDGVKGGVRYGTMGNTGISGAAHVDFGIYNNENAYKLSLARDAQYKFVDIFDNKLYDTQDWAGKFSGLGSRDWTKTPTVEKYMLEQFRKQYGPMAELLMILGN